MHPTRKTSPAGSGWTRGREIANLNKGLMWETKSYDGGARAM